MLAISFHTLKLAQKLRERVKFSQEQAEKMAVVMAESFAEWTGNANLATHDDVVEMRGEMKNLRYDMEKMEGRLEARIAETKAIISETKADILKWLFGAIGLQTIVILGALFGLLHNIGKV